MSSVISTVNEHPYPVNDDKVASTTIIRDCTYHYRMARMLRPDLFDELDEVFRISVGNIKTDVRDVGNGFKNRLDQLKVAGAHSGADGYVLHKNK